MSRKLFIKVTEDGYGRNRKTGISNQGTGFEESPLGESNGRQKT